MKLKLMAALPLTMFGAACGIDPKIESAAFDPAVLETCPRTIAAPGELVARQELVITEGQYAGMRVVPVENANERENMLVRGALVFKDGYLKCRSVVIYVEDRDKQLGE